MTTSDIEMQPSILPGNLASSSAEVRNKLKVINIRKTVGPDQLNNRILVESSQELSLVLLDIYNTTLSQSYIPDMLKASTVTPTPKVVPPKSIEEDLDP